LVVIYAEHRKKSMNLREYLEKREPELLSELAALYAETKRKEAELAEVRRAKVSIGMLAPWHADPELTRFAAVEDLAQSLASPGVRLRSSPPSPYAHLTMKQLVMRALGEHLRSGATRRELIDFFRDAWGREIEPASLSPQLSRLMNEGMIVYRDEDHRWILTADGTVLSMPVALLDAEIVAEKAENAGSDDLTQAIADAKLRAVISDQRTPEQQAVLDVLKKLQPQK
jgi:hypothetical protein